MNKTISLIAVAILAAVSAKAAELNWNRDAVAQAGNPGIQVLKAQALGTGIINHTGNDWDETLELTLNNDGDRVGVEYTTCDPSTEHSSEYMPTCEYLEFYLADLSVQGKSIVWNGEAIGQIKKGFFTTHVKLNKGYKLRAVKEAAVLDGGFNREHVARVAIYLQKSN